MESKSYEYLLSSVFQNGSTSRGVDAEMYNVMLEEHDNILTKNFYDSHQERVHEFRKAFVIVREQVLASLIEGGKKIILKALESDMLAIQSMADTLTQDFFDISELNSIIVKGIRLFNKYGLVSSVNNSIYAPVNNNSTYRAFRN